MPQLFYQPPSPSGNLRKESTQMRATPPPPPPINIISTMSESDTDDDDSLTIIDHQNNNNTNTSTNTKNNNHVNDDEHLLPSSIIVNNRKNSDIINRKRSLSRAGGRGDPTDNLLHLFAQMDMTKNDDNDDNNCDIVDEINKRAHALCIRFLGGCWKNTDADRRFRLKPITGGMSNMLFLCELLSDGEQIDEHQSSVLVPNRVLLRIYCDPDPDHHLTESVIFTLLSERRLGPRLYGVFSGGRFEEFIPSRCLSCAELAVPSISIEIGRLLARVHILDVPTKKEPDLCDIAGEWLKKLTNIGRMEPIQLDKLTITIDKLHDELAFVRRCVENSSSPIVFCHNDLQEGNILLLNESIDKHEHKNGNVDQQRLIFIDFEYASYNYRAFDFANHFCEFTIDYDYKTPPHYRIIPNRYPTIKQQRAYFASYLKEMSTICSIVNNDDTIDGLIIESRRFIAVSHLFWSIWALLLAETAPPIEFGYAQYGRDRLALYMESRQHLAELHPK